MICEGVGKTRNSYSFSKILDFNKKKYERKYSEKNFEPFGAKSDIISKKITFAPTKSLNTGSNKE